MAFGGAKEKTMTRSAMLARRGFLPCESVLYGLSFVRETLGLRRQVAATAARHWRQASGGTMMWTVIYIAPTAKMAENIRKRLTEESFLVKIRPVNLSKQQYEILVPSGELEEVQEVFNSIIRP